MMVIMRGSNTFETPQSKFHTINRINHEIPFHFMKKVQAMFSVKHLFSTSLDFCLCRNKTSHFHKFHLKHSYIKKIITKYDQQNFHFNKKICVLGEDENGQHSYCDDQKVCDDVKTISTV